MQRMEDGMVVIACDFTGEDWDGESPMIEGHKGSVISLPALARAVEEATETETAVACTMCLQEREPGMRVWRGDEGIEGREGAAVICWDCIQQADRTFARDPEVEWDRKIAPTKRWR
ncbi:hypothetical protein [Mucisphaera calidilacus]|uniref:ClpX-type ZB domain-containing protein n=1 Tax=Mucisphaera calidilacus TaxID=2527982 RepID=A0A518BTB8_9BACT|nr:hypothetical protein [Mucisphaera calidilacus]QDU70217.1 hypothetical protein Pan265_00390 [Mucisphaera calidilacus]